MGGWRWSGTGRGYSLLTSAMLEVLMDATDVAVGGCALNSTSK